MRKINNPFAGRPSYNCFGCSPDNPHGLHLEFFEDGEEVVCNWTPEDNLQGYDKVLHGGIQSTLMDEIASWTVYVKAKTAGVTARMEVKFRKPVFVDAGPLTVRGKIISQNKRIVTIYTRLFDANGICCAEGKVDYFVMPPDQAKEKLNYPGYERFFE
ncbi:MAG TPA: PaaI family thioesterase [Bacteroidales bacterium]|nr:PaaI family thioesterase [Bacteroidales bacterium]